MISKLTMKITPPENGVINNNMSSLTHGWLMSTIDKEFADKMHESALHPFSQYITLNKNGAFWIVNTLTDEAEENIIRPLLETDSITLRHDEKEYILSEHSIEKTSFDDMFVRNYISGKPSNIVSMRFTTPTAFKSGGRYVYFPDTKLIFSSIINKYDSSSESTKIYDEKLIEEIPLSTEIVGYNLRSTFFHMEGVRIPSFVGSIKIKVRGNSNMVSLINMLAEFARYSGVGIKTSLGMGGIGYFEKRGKENE